MHARRGAGAIVALASCLALPTSAAAHGGHSRQPLGIIDPLITHHAILEDELKLNYFGAKLGDDQHSSHTGSLEIAFAFTDLIGVELFVPFGALVGGGEVSGGLGDLELQVPKISFLREEGFVMTTYVAVRTPTGHDDSGLGEPGWTFAPHLLVDVGIEDLGLQLNVAGELDTGGEIALESNFSLAYSFRLDDQGRGVVSPLVEANLELPVRGEETGEAILAITPGLKFSFGGWHVGAGAQIPVTEHREFDFRALVQVGYHVTWEDLFGDESEDDASEGPST